MAGLYDRGKLFTTEYLGEAFQYLDSNNDGFIVKSELQKALKGCDEQEY